MLSAETTCTPLPGTGPVRPADGLACSLASLARNLLGATPTLHVSFSSVRTSVRMAAATSVGGPWRRSDPATSRNASSSDNGSTSGVYRRKTSITRRLTSP